MRAAKSRTKNRVRKILSGSRCEDESQKYLRCFFEATQRITPRKIKSDSIFEIEGVEKAYEWVAGKWVEGEKL